MLKRINRLNSFALKNSKQISAKYFTLKFSNNGDEVNRFAFVVSKKTDTRATARNEMKRKVRAGVESLLDKTKKGYDFIIYPKKEALNTTSIETARELKDVLQKENLLND